MILATTKSSCESQQGQCKDRCNGMYRSLSYYLKVVVSCSCFFGSFWKGWGLSAETYLSQPSCKVSCIQNGSASGKLMKKNYLLTFVLQALCWLQQVRDGELGGRQWYHHSLPVLSSDGLCHSRPVWENRSLVYLWVSHFGSLDGQRVPLWSSPPSLEALC